MVQSILTHSVTFSRLDCQNCLKLVEVVTVADVDAEDQQFVADLKAEVWSR